MSDKSPDLEGKLTGSSRAGEIEANAGVCSISQTSCGRTESGSFTTSDCTLDSDGTRLDIWEFAGTAGQQVTITMSSSAFDPYLLLSSPSNVVVAQDDDSGGGTSARIVFTLNESGTWAIGANQFEPGLGSYSLSLVCSSVGTPPPSCSGGAISCGQTISSSLATGDCTLPDGAFTEVWTFSGSAGQRIVATMRSGAVDAYLALRDPSGNVVADDDDSGGGSGDTDARIDFTLTQSGTWTLLPTTFEPGESGSYTLELSCPSGNTPGPCGTCVADSRTACLLGNRFKVTMPSWRDPNANLNGQGSIIRYAENQEEVHPELGPLSGGVFFSMYSFAPDSIEVILRMIKGATINDKYWVFMTGFTGAEYTIRVQDTQTCAVWERTVQAGATNVIKDFEAFPFP